MSSLQEFSEYKKSVSFLENLSNLPLKHNYMKDRSHLSVYLKRLRYFLNLVDNPDRGFKFIHVTGTAGKGTVTNMIHEMLHSAEYVVGSTSSPFLTTTIEKFRLGDSYMDPKDFVRIVDSLIPHIEYAHLHGPYGHPSLFDIYFVIMMIYFKEQKCQWVVLEVGMGGRYDYTNVIEHSEISIITNIAKDHTDLLGNSLMGIAYEKAGIIKSNSHFFTTEKKLSLIKFFKKNCSEKNTIFHKLDAGSSSKEANINLVCAVSDHIGISRELQKKVIHNFKLPGRFEQMQSNPKIILDGAHNPIKIQSVIDNLIKNRHKKVHLIFASMANKDAKSMLKLLIPYCKSISLTRPSSSHRAVYSLKEMKNYIQKNSPQMKVSVFLNPQEALEKQRKLIKKNETLLITGSFYLVGELRSLWYSEDYILKHRRSF